MSKLKPAPGYERCPITSRAGRRGAMSNTSPNGYTGSSVRPGAYAHTDYDFKKPGADLMAKSGPAVRAQTGRRRESTASPARISRSAAATAGRDPARGTPGRRTAHRRGRYRARPVFRLHLQAGRLSARGPEPGVSGGQRRIQAVRSGTTGARPTSTARTSRWCWAWRLPPCPIVRRAITPQADHARPADGDGGRAVGRGDIHRQILRG